MLWLLGETDSEQGWWKSYGKRTPYAQEMTAKPMLNQIKKLRSLPHKEIGGKKLEQGQRV